MVQAVPFFALSSVQTYSSSVSSWKRMSFGLINGWQSSLACAGSSSHKRQLGLRCNPLKNLRRQSLKISGSLLNGDGMIANGTIARG